ncbi:hypothetical protein [Patulibacter minatonensis]|uniref:hypothetical protein n=1 Tax=Patulibacter minatonensis TaxID=298163 RepID=UPI0012FAB30F|nr:hypothetical protein [Patulibacter minatonensis]
MPAPRSSTPATRARPFAALVVAAAAAGLSGCGQAQEVRDALGYTTSVNRIIAGLDRDQRRLNEESRDFRRPAEVASGLRRLAGDVDRVRADLGKVRPPEVVARLHRDLIGSYGRLSAPIQRFQLLVRKGRRPAIVAGQQAYRRENDAIQRTIDATLVRINAELARLSD